MATHTLVTAWHREVRLGTIHAHNTGGLATYGGFGRVIAAGDVTHVREGEHQLGGGRRQGFL
eukprot:CAMPEP_0174708450 /NCGR_PEP_ID=MMETSP1094-20130205/10702_1 /TAXON_ID=156173 /ORGANISM="Chrysochromulina brevifilum, Strain UTEX LB 985" /LENGTH=61 /DNA_ID=CAMNT_0015907011 /DNA_START=294 /DNA_END=475 /DNA_ORIENTATION=+